MGSSQIFTYNHLTTHSFFFYVWPIYINQINHISVIIFKGGGGGGKILEGGGEGVYILFTRL